MQLDPFPVQSVLVHDQRRIMGAQGIPYSGQPPVPIRPSHYSTQAQSISGPGVHGVHYSEPPQVPGQVVAYHCPSTTELIPTFTSTPAYVPHHNSFMSPVIDGQGADFEAPPPYGSYSTVPQPNDSLAMINNAPSLINVGGHVMPDQTATCTPGPVIMTPQRPHSVSFTNLATPVTGDGAAMSHIVGHPMTSHPSILRHDTPSMLLR